MTDGARPDVSGRWTARRVLRAVSRRAARAGRLACASFRDTRVTRESAARELGVAPSSIDAAVRRVREQLAAALPVSPADAASLRSALLRHAPAQLDALRAAADRAAGRAFDLLGSGPVPLGRPIEWHRDFKSGAVWPANAHYTRIRLGIGPGADVKVPWELSRGHHLVWLAQSAALEGRADHAREAVAQIREWIAANRPEYGVNWVSAMEAGIRAVNWIWAAALLSSHPEVPDAFYEELAGSLAAHGRFIEANLEEHSDGIRTNHYIADVVGLFYIGECLPGLARAARWSAFARAALEREIATQVLPDGASFESSVAYHRLVAEMFLSAWAIAARSGRPFSAGFRSRLEGMLEFTAACTKPNGLTPQIGDADDGRLHVLSGHGADVRDHRHLLAAGAVLFNREDLWRAAGDRWPEGLWYGGAAARQWQTPPEGRAPAAASRAFVDAGLFVLRRDRDAVIVSAGPVGTSGLGNHKHNDLLSFEAHLDGEDVLVDAGSFVYSADPAARNAFRSTLMHNTVMIDGVEQNDIPENMFALAASAVPKLRAWQPSTEGGRVNVEHDGYMRLRHPVVHARTVRLGAEGLAIEDSFASDSSHSHQFVWTFLFAPGVSVHPDAGGWIVRLASGRDLRLTWPHDHLSARFGIVADSTTGFVSPRYGVRQEVALLRWTWAGRAPAVARFNLER